MSNWAAARGREIRIAEFKAANESSPVVYGSALDERRGGGGCFYRLADGRTFTLDAEACRAVGYPRWSFDPQKAD